LLRGTQIFSSLREIWVRDVYLEGDFLSVPQNAVVVDLGANQGVFSTLALAQNPSARVVAVEPSLAFVESLEKGIRANGWSARVTAIRAFVGNFTEKQKEALRQGSDYADAPMMTEAELIARAALSKIDLLKCDIEGSEFFLLEPQSRLLAMTNQLAIELHKWGGDIRGFLNQLTRMGFEVGPVTWAHDSCIALCRRRVPVASPTPVSTGLSYEMSG
jgi:FkbM family methyltransferase